MSILDKYEKAFQAKDEAAMNALSYLSNIDIISPVCNCLYIGIFFNNY